MNFYDMARLLYLETDVSGVGLGARLLQIRDVMNCGHDGVPDIATLNPSTLTSKSLMSTEQCYSSIENETLGILHGLERFPHYCFDREVCIITDHRSLVAILSKDVAMLSPQLQCIMLCIHWYRVCII